MLAAAAGLGVLAAAAAPDPPVPPPQTGPAPPGTSLNGTVSGYLGTTFGTIAGTATGRWYPPRLSRAGVRRPPLKEGVLWTTGEPQFESPRGFDVSPVQSVGLRFSLEQPGAATGVALWLMRNGGGDCNRPEVVIELHKGGEVVPGTDILATTDTECTAHGWVAVKETAELSARFKAPVELEPHTHYWIVAKSEAAAGCNGVWVMAPLNVEQQEYVALSPPFEPDQWQDTIGYTTTPTAELYGCHRHRTANATADVGRPCHHHH